jgi:ribonuclease P protein component
VDDEVRATFPHSYRVVRGSDYRTAYKKGFKLDSERFVLFSRKNGLDHPRLGLTVSRKVGGAVVRNRVKRLFREIFRRSRAGISAPVDLVINAKRPCATAGYHELNEEFLILVRRLLQLQG